MLTRRTFLTTIDVVPVHDPNLCMDHLCECHTIPEMAVFTPFPFAIGNCRTNPYCCNKCALALPQGTLG
jgi:hypothetical protein